MIIKMGFFTIECLENNYVYIVNGLTKKLISKVCINPDSSIVAEIIEKEAFTNNITRFELKYNDLEHNKYNKKIVFVLDREQLDMQELMIFYSDNSEDYMMFYINEETETETETETEFE